MLSISVEAHDDVITLASSIAKARTEGAAHAASFGPVEPSYAQFAQDDGGVV